MIDQFANLDDIESACNGHAHGKDSFAVEANDLRWNFYRTARDRRHVGESDDLGRARSTDAHISHGLHIMERECRGKANTPLTVGDRASSHHLVFLRDAREHRVDRQTETHEACVVYLNENRFERFARRCHLGHAGNHLETVGDLSRHVENVSLGVAGCGDRIQHAVHVAIVVFDDRYPGTRRQAPTGFDHTPS